MKCWGVELRNRFMLQVFFRVSLWLRFVLPVVVGTSLFTDRATASDRPNIVIIMVDDLGWADFGCYGSEIQTPNIDASAEGGIRFRNFYNTAKCHSSRVSLLTGLYCDQAGGANLNRGVTIAEVLNKAGYGTAMVGKWHLAKEPTDFGFGRYFGHLSGATNFFVGDDTFRLNGKKWNDFGDDFYTTNAWLKYGKQFVGEMIEEDADRPFFLYVAHNAPHYPLHVLKQDYEKYDGVYDSGWDAIRTTRNARQKEIGIVPDNWNVADRPELVPAWEELDPKVRDFEIRKMQAFAGMVDRVDQVTGELVEYLKAKGVHENTLIMLCADNGACPFDRTRGAEFEPWDSRSYWCYDTGWSHVGNTPFRLYKQNQHEGGISSPMIAHWPAGIKQPGSINDEVGHLIDFMATAIDLGEAEYPDHWPGREVDPLVGKSLGPIFESGEREDHEFLYFHFGDNRAIRKGDWKVVTHRASRWELFDLSNDPTELNDLASEHPEKLKELSELWHTTAKDVDRLSGKAIRPVSGNPPPLLKKNGTPDKSKK